MKRRREHFKELMFIVITFVLPNYFQEKGITIDDVDDSWIEELREGTDRTFDTLMRTLDDK